jgi:hypothetical protein
MGFLFKITLNCVSPIFIIYSDYVNWTKNSQN